MRLLRFLALPLAAAALFAAALARAGDTAAAAVPRVVPEQFLPQLTAQLAEHFHLEQELQLDLLHAWTPPATPATAWEMKIVTPPAQLRPQNIVRVRLQAGGRSLGEWNLPLQAQLWAEALVVRQTLAKGELLDGSLFELRRADFLRERDAVPATAVLEGYAPRRGLDAGAMLAWRDLEKRPLVLRGQKVEVTATDGQIAITLKGLAMENGALGDSITVRNPDSRRDFSGVVTGANRVRVTF